MAVLKMQKISICALKKDRKAILEQLQHLGVLEVDLLALQIDVTGILGVNAKEAFHQGGLTGAVFAHQGMDRTGPHGQIDTVQSLDTGEFLGNALHPQQDGLAVLIQIVRLLSWGTRPGKASWARSGSARTLPI